MTQAELGAALWLNKSTIQRYETGKITKIKVPVIHAIAKQLNVDPNWLMGEIEKLGEYVPRFDKFEKWGENTVRITYQYCHFCGQKLDWDDHPTEKDGEQE